MSSTSILLLRHLDELIQDDFERFKWSLMNNKAQGFESISRSKLEKAKQFEVVDLMVDKYEPSEAAKITVQVLRQIGQEKLASDLEKKLEGEGHVQAAEGDGVCSSSSSSSSSSKAVGVSMNISAEGGSSINAPPLSGGIFNGPVNINFSSK
ncbi:hypothetical protein KOW79_021006 [Hemibagrus wyckioides]|uniref:Pyrin domain-containing protein n=1 Tax=Hemibagrus wyckioides TaxID=337641 RepID=A0A9D3N7X1_9TELE|nr:hypothetical protein KOW79_021006 [Hemibagrus wyckioides]